MMAATGKTEGLLGMGEVRDASSGTRTVELFKLFGYNFYNILFVSHESLLAEINCKSLKNGTI